MSAPDTSPAAMPRPTHLIYINRAHVFDAGVTWTTVAGLYPHAYAPVEAFDALSAERDRLAAALDAANARAEAAKNRKQFPVLGGCGAMIDYQLVVDHGEQAKRNHYQTVERLAQRGGLGWSELYAVLHNKPFQKLDANDAMIACRSLEARYLAALEKPHD